MSKRISKGFREAIVGVVLGVLLSALLGIIPTLSFVPSQSERIFQLVEIILFVGGILLILKMESWGVGYLLGWLFGMWIMYYSGMVESWLFTLYAVVGVFFVAMKMAKKVERALR